MTKKYSRRGFTAKISHSKRKNKEFMVELLSGKKIHFSNPKMKEFPGTKRGNSYCARSSGIKGKNDPKSANYWSRELWSCVGKKSISKKRFFGLLTLK